MGYEVLRRISLADAPASNGIVTLFDSTSTLFQPGTWRGVSWKALVFNIFTSHASATNGYTVEESDDGGVNWDPLPAPGSSVTIPATTRTKLFVKVSALDVRVRYQNSANILTTFRGSLLADIGERGNG